MTAASVRSTDGGGVGRKSLALLFGLLLAAQSLLVVTPVALAADDTAEIAGVWSGSGPAGTTASTVRNGTGGIAEFYYEKNLGIAGGVPLTTWTFSTVAAQSGTVNLAYLWEGLHAWFQVTASLSTFVTHLGSTTFNPLVTAGPANCCTTPSNGFSYGALTSIPVQAGDTFGFRITGSNGDSNSFLRGTLRVATNVIRNGSFERPVVSEGGFTTLTGTDLTDWVVDTGDVQFDQ